MTLANDNEELKPLVGLALFSEHFIIKCVSLSTLSMCCGGVGCVSSLSPP